MQALKNVYLWWQVRLKYGLHFGKPSYILRLLLNIARAKLYSVLGRKIFILRGIDFAATYSCNFRCEHCYARNLENSVRKLMTVEEYSSVCRQAMRLGCLCFSLQGGEVFLRPDWEDVIKALQPENNHIFLTSNGSLITDDLVVRLKRLGLDTLYLSLDSGIAGEHDAFRRHEGSFAKVMQAVKYCKAHRLKVVFNISVTKTSLYSEGFRRALDFCMREKILAGTIFVSSLGSFAGSRHLLLDDNDRAYYYKLRRNYPVVVRDLDNNYGGWGCPSVKEALYITAYGDVCPCPYIHVSLGNIRSESLAAIRARGLTSQWFDHYHDECLPAVDRSFGDIYYPLLEKSSLVSFEQFEAHCRNAGRSGMNRGKTK